MKTSVATYSQAVVQAKYLHDYLIEVTFFDHSVRVVDLENFFKTSNWELVRKFAPLAKFKQFYIDPEIGTLAWGDNECDIDPFDIYEGRFDAKLEYA
ncbi:MAG: DUF2442 domain-containing protein [Bacteroidales bacterium]|jgi:hypothetical protein|nr:DUF2442 domain-containing protein [Bacteroidales bacterium]